MFKRTQIVVRSVALTLLAGVAACEGPAPEQAVEVEHQAISTAAIGEIMPFGDLDGSCLAVVAGGRLQTAPCTTNIQQIAFSFYGDTITQTQTGQCLDLNFGDLSAGNVSVTTCNGTINQKWSIVGGQITSFNKSDGQTHCLDMRFSGNTVAGVAVCNGTAAQVFTTTGAPMKFGSTMSFTTTNPTVVHKECLDVLFNNETVGATLDDSECNGSDAQWFDFDTTRRLHLVNAPSLCVSRNGSTSGVSLQTCSTFNDPQQMWFFTNKGRNATGGLVSLNNMYGGCLDIYQGSNANGQLVDDVTCNGTNAQIWQPTIINHQ